jgi:putative two-component system response regulator
MPNPRRILVVDDIEQNRRLLAAILESLGYAVETAGDGQEALEKLPLAIDAILLDVMMPGIDGYEVTRRVRQQAEYCDVPIILVTALDGREDRLRAVAAGASDFISKPVEKTELQVRLSSQLQLKDATELLKSSHARLEETVTERTVSLRQALEEVSKAKEQLYAAHLDTIQRLVVAAEYKDRATAEHIQRISRYGVVLAELLNLASGDIDLLRHSIPMHDVGKLGIPDAILLKPGALTAEERRIMNSHTLIGASILAGSRSELLQAGEIIALSHHEHWDGRGYPNGVSGEGIHLWGRICALVDVFDALTSDRPYRPALSSQEAFALMSEGRGTQFDPELFDVFAANLSKFVAIHQSLGNDPKAGS